MQEKEYREALADMRQALTQARRERDRGKRVSLLDYIASQALALSNEVREAS